MIRTVVIDDEIHCVKSLRWDLQEVAPDVEVVGTAASGPEGLQLIQELNPALVFLDVSMPGMNGFEMLEALPEISFSLIFTTAFDQYAALAFRKSAVDFLVKPIDKNDLSEAISKVKQTKAIEMPENNIFNLLNNYRQPEARQRIAFPTRDGYEFAMPDHILYLEAEGSYTKIFFDDKRHLLVSRSLGDIADLLPGSDFARIHHSFIVNLSGITHFLRTDGGYVQLKNGVKLMVSKSRKNEIMERLGLK